MSILRGRDWKLSLRQLEDRKEAYTAQWRWPPCEVSLQTLGRADAVKPRQGRQGARCQWLAG